VRLGEPVSMPRLGSGGRRITDPQTMRASQERRNLRYGRNIERGLTDLEAQNTEAAAAVADRDELEIGARAELAGKDIRGWVKDYFDIQAGLHKGVGLEWSPTNWGNKLAQYLLDRGTEEEEEAPSAAPEAPSAAPEAPTGDDNVPSTPDTGDTSRSAAYNWGLKPDTPVGPPDDPNGTKDDDTAVSVAAIQAAIAAANQKKAPFGSVGSTPVLAKQVGPLNWSTMRLKPETKKLGPSYRPPTPSYKARYA